ncbi:Major facilitator superfamily MFS_1 [Yersinia kristensenii ATCC 33638]|nr:Major facilitator superfamily MFS_1 [Yersinia kristensenii ATCC 33638]
MSAVNCIDRVNPLIKSSNIIKMCGVSGVISAQAKIATAFNNPLTSKAERSCVMQIGS